MTSGNADRPTLLLVGAGEPMQDALRVALDRHRVDVESCEVEEVSEAVTVSAPDLVLLLGNAAEEGGHAVLRVLAEQPATSVVPVALLADDHSLGHRLRAFRSGAVAVIERGASADAMARRVVEVAKELPERPGEARGQLGEATLDDLVKLVSQELRSGILSVEAQGQHEDAVRVVLGAGGPVAEALDDFVKRIRPLIAKAEPLQYEFHEASGGRLGFLDLDGDAGDLSILAGLRILVMDNDPGRADVLAQALRERRAQVAVTNVSIEGLERGERLDPEIIILDAAAIEGEGFEAVRSVRRNPRLRWASLLVARWEELWMKEAGLPDIEKLAGQIAPLTQHDIALRSRASKQQAFDTRLELTGPSRLLRALARTPGTHHVTVRSPKATLEIDLSDGLLVGAQGTRHGPKALPVEGLAAVTMLMMLTAGRVRVEKRGHPSCANVMTPVDEALSSAGLDVPAVAPTVPPPSLLEEETTDERVVVAGVGAPAERPPVRVSDKQPGAGLRGPSRPDQHEVLGSGTPPGGRSRAGTMLGMAPIGRIQPVKTPSSGTDRDSLDLRDDATEDAADPRTADSEFPTHPPAGLSASSPDSFRPTQPPKRNPPPPAAPPVLRVPSPADFGVKVPPAKAKAPAPAPKPKAPAPAPKPRAPAPAAKPKAPAPAPAAKARARTIMGVGAVGDLPPRPAAPEPAPSARKAPPVGSFETREPTSAPAIDDDFVDLGSGLLEVPESLQPPSPPAGGGSAGAFGVAPLDAMEDAPTEAPPPFREEDAWDEPDVEPPPEGFGSSDAPPPEAPLEAAMEAAPSGEAHAPTEVEQSFGLPPTLEAPAGAEEVREDDPTTIHSTNKPWPTPEPRPHEVVEAEAPQRSRILVAVVAILVVGVLATGAGVVFMLTRDDGAQPPVASAPTAAPPAAVPAPSETATGAPSAAPPPAAVEVVEAEVEVEASPEGVVEEEVAVVEEPDQATEEEPDQATEEEPPEEEPEAVAEDDVIDSSLRRLARRDPDTAAEHAARQAQLHIARGELGEARVLIDFALEADSTSHYAWAAEARYALAQGNAAAGLEWAEKAMRRRPRRSDYHVLVGDALAARGDTAGARQAYERALELDPRDSDARERLSR